MGLAIEVGMLADQLVHDPEGAAWLRESVTTVNQILARNGLGGWQEPETIADAERRGLHGYPYGFLHHLRRAFAFVRQGRELTPVEELSPADDAVVEDESMMMGSHLLCHSDAEGFYAPVDFDEPIFDDGVPGGMLGSSHGLRRELREVAVALGIELVDGNPTEAAIAGLEILEEGAPLWRARIVWLSLWEAARVSIRDRTMIVFC